MSFGSSIMMHQRLGKIHSPTQFQQITVVSIYKTVQTILRYFQTGLLQLPIQEAEQNYLHVYQLVQNEDSLQITLQILQEIPMPTVFIQVIVIFKIFIIILSELPVHTQPMAGHIVTKITPVILPLKTIFSRTWVMDMLFTVPEQLPILYRITMTYIQTGVLLHTGIA